MAIHLEAQLNQIQTLSPKMLQFMNILQLSTVELAAFLNAAALENPLVDIEDNCLAIEDVVRERTQEWLERLDEQNRVAYHYNPEENNEHDISSIGEPSAETLSDFLIAQLIGLNYSETEMRIFRYIAGSLDSKGYFSQTAEDVAAFCSCSAAQAKRALDIMRNLEPAGICAKDMASCLLKQLEKKSGDFDVERRILSECLDLLAQNRLHQISRQLDVPLERVRQAQREIRALHPIPGNGFSDRKTLKYIVPDVIVVKTGDAFDVYINDAQLPSLKTSKDYLRMLNDPSCPEDAKKYILQKQEEISYLRQCIANRNDTILRLSMEIVRRQLNFFVYGNQSLLKPWRMSEASKALQMHESTISRTCKDKYLQCCWGIYPLGYFFPRGFASDTGQASLTSAEIQTRIREIIQAEDKTRPLSDQAIVGALSDDGITASRRVVAKYREAMQIPSSRERKL